MAAVSKDVAAPARAGWVGAAGGKTQTAQGERDALAARVAEAPVEPDAHGAADSSAARDMDGLFAGYVERFCQAQAVERGLSPNTVRAYRLDLHDYGRWAQRCGVDALAATHRQIRLYLAELDQARYTRRTVNRRLSAVKGFFRWMVAEGFAQTDPASVLQGPKEPKNLPRRICAADMAALLAVHAASTKPADQRNQALLEFLYACGARISEASGLLVANVDFDARQVKVFGKGSKERIIPLHDVAVATMRSYYWHARPELLDGAASPYFFVSTRGNRMGTDSMRKMFKKTLRAAGLDETLSPHDVRHTFATDVLEGGADLRSVQEMLGHASLSTTQVYTHVSIAHLKEEHRLAHPRA